MIITDKFVYIHMPKTGGTFVSTLLEKIHTARGDGIVRRRADEKPKFSLSSLWSSKPTFLILANQQDNGDWNQHGTTAQIPAEHRHKPVLTTIRNPYDRYVSQYEFQWWKQRTAAFTNDMEGLLKKYPHYPDISFEDFLQISNTFFLGEPNTRFMSEDRLGRHTAQFIRYFYTDPAKISEIDAAYLAKKCYQRDLHPTLRFTFTDQLNQGLHDFLIETGYQRDEIAFILEHEKIFPKEGGRSEAQKWQKYYTPELKAWLRHRERMLFEMFPNFDV